MFTALLIHNIGKIESLNISILSTKLAPKVLAEFNHLKQQLSRFRAFLLGIGFEERIPLSFAHLKPDAYVHLVDLVGNLGDSLENYLTEVSRHQTRVQNIFLSLPNNYHMPRFQLRVRDAIFRLEAIAEIFLDLEFPAKRVTRGIIERWRETSSVVEAEVKGREYEKEMIVQRLVESCYEEDLEVIPIVGIGGIGKTALATLVYNDVRVTSYFELRSWAHVSRNSSLRSIAEGILKPFHPQRIPKNIENTMQLIGQIIQGKRWLLVLDGVEDKDLIMILLSKLKSASVPDSKVLMTMRSSFIPMSITRQTPVHLKGLSVQDAWSLLESIAFKEGQKPRDPRIIETGKEIIKEICEGVPLIIKVIGSLLHNKDSLQEWLFFKKNGLLKSSQIPSANVKIIFESLKSSLDHHPAYLQLCFTYCGLFPKRRDIDLHTLIALWMAQGFIYSNTYEGDHRRTEDIGYGCFCKLLELNLFHGHDVQEDEWDRDTSCRMQDVMHDLALYVSNNRIILMDPRGETVHKNVLHVTLDFNLDSSWQIPKSLLKAQELRTILLSPQSRLPHEMKLSTSTCHAIFSSFKRLRVLDLHDLGMKTVPNSLGKLKYLRYLDLSQNSFTTLPRSTTNLFNLQTLKLSNCHMLKELPKGFNNLINLRHLEIDGCFSLTHMPLGLGCLTSLQTLSRFVVSKIHNSASTAAGLEQLMSLDKLRGNLEILHLERVKCDPSKDHNPFLDKKQQLQCLTLRWNRDFDDDEVEEGNSNQGDDERLLKILKPHRNLKALYVMGFKGRFSSGYFTDLNLVRLSLYYCPIIQFLPPLHQLPFLQILELQRLEAMESIADSSASAPTEPFFPSLMEVTIWDCPRLTSWWKSGAAFPDGTAEFPSRCIQKLEIRYCPELTTIPFYPEKLILVCYSMDQLERLMKKMAERPSFSPSHASSSSSSPVHSGLKSLIIGRIEDLKSLPEEGLKSFTSLQCLHIQDCHKLTSLLQGIQHLSSLEYLNIENCMELNLNKDEDDGSQWNGLINLRTLIIKGIPKLEALPQGLAHANSLQDLQLYSCPQLISLPKWIGNLTSLDTLTIEDCPKLLPRCQQETGEDWPQIAHIKNKSLK